ncbi:nitroreductase family protein [Leucobacter weissii]|uniref:Putative NAD(P)H nitroreductase n=1 Tax=Leucobacter weissii TaxID=1983706 RepID=A0A939MLH7_9MICO|nr:nitroreductase family protein [Leucobacter weissii]MBO1900636.1 nitroreductase family protein [Leucobacter weissii]
MTDPTDPSTPGALRAVRARRSHSRVTEDAPERSELEGLVSALASVADHSGLRPWRIIEWRGDERRRLGRALAKAGGMSREKGIAKATRAPLVLAIVVSPRPSKKVPVWEQEAVASGAAHLLSLLLDEAGWGVIWRTGSPARSKAARRAHRLDKHEYLLGWLYVGGIPERSRKPKPRKPLDLARHLSTP